MCDVTAQCAWLSLCGSTVCVTFEILLGWRLASLRGMASEYFGGPWYDGNMSSAAIRTAKAQLTPRVSPPPLLLLREGSW